MVLRGIVRADMRSGRLSRHVSYGTAEGVGTCMLLRRISHDGGHLSQFWTRQIAFEDDCMVALPPCSCVRTHYSQQQGEHGSRIPGDGKGGTGGCINTNDIPTLLGRSLPPTQGRPVDADPSQLTILVNRTAAAPLSSGHEGTNLILGPEHGKPITQNKDLL